MAIAPWGCFDYVGEFAAGGFEPDAIVLQGRSRVESHEAVLVGHKPKIRFWNERVNLEAPDAVGATVHRATFAVGDAVSLTARSGDLLSLVCTGTLGLSIVRDGKLVLALGAVAEVHLGMSVQATNSFEDGESSEAWLEVSTAASRHRFRQRESGRVGDYDVYVERTCTWHRDTDGVAECGSIVRAGDVKTTNAAMRSAVLIAHENIDLVQGEHWDGRFIRSTRRIYGSPTARCTRRPRGEIVSGRG